MISTVSILLLMFALSTHYAKAQSSGRFPVTDTFNGMAISYSVSGVSLTAPVDISDFTTSRTFNGTITGSTVTVSGTLHFDWTASVTGSATVTVGSATQSVSYDCTTNDTRTTVDQPFSVSVDVPSNAGYGSFSISMSAEYGNGEGRGLVVSGQFLAPPSTVDHVVVVSPYDSVMAGDGPFTVTATVYGIGNSQVHDGTEVTLSLTDKEGGVLVGASIQPQTALTLNSAITATFTPPSAAYWDDPLHANYAGQNSITITAFAGGKQGGYEIVIQNPARTVAATTDSGGTVNLAISGSITSSQMSNAKIATDQSAVTTTVSFNVTGDSGTTGFSNVTIPKSAVPYGTTPTVYIDDQLAQSQGHTQDANNYYVWYTTQFSTHKLSFVFATGQANAGPPWIIIGIIAAIVVLVVVVVAVLLVRRRKPAVQTIPSGFPPPPPLDQLRFVLPRARDTYNSINDGTATKSRNTCSGSLCLHVR